MCVKFELHYVKRNYECEKSDGSNGTWMINRQIETHAYLQPCLPGASPTLFQKFNNVVKNRTLISSIFLNLTTMSSC